jgi:hypothetical protein
MTVNRSLVAVASIAASVLGAVTATAGASQERGRSASAFELTFDGRHELDPEETAVWEVPVFDHVGSFTASGDFCPSGSMTTTTGYSESWEATRVLTCADGSGSVTAVLWSLIGDDGEHSGAGNWRLISGTGAYARLRGQGTFVSSRTGGDWFDHGSLTFRSRWVGVAELDDVPPALAISSATATKLRRSNGAYSVQVALALGDDVEGNPVSYTLRAAIHPSTRSPGWTPEGFELTRESGTADAETVSMTLVVRPPARAKSIRLHLVASDPVGNERGISQALKLPR